MMKKAPAFVPREGGFQLREIAKYLHVNDRRLMNLAAEAGVRIRFVSIGQTARRASVTEEEARAIILRFHVKRRLAK